RSSRKFPQLGPTMIDLARAMNGVSGQDEELRSRVLQRLGETDTGWTPSGSERKIAQLVEAVEAARPEEAERFYRRFVSAGEIETRPDLLLFLARAWLEAGGDSEAAELVAESLKPTLLQPHGGGFRVPLTWGEARVFPPE